MLITLKVKKLVQGFELIREKGFSDFRSAVSKEDFAK